VPIFHAGHIGIGGLRIIDLIGMDRLGWWEIRHEDRLISHLLLKIKNGVDVPYDPVGSN
jgi:hypothetical protein